MSRPSIITAVFCVQLLCGVFFLFNIATSVFGLVAINWQVHELIELGAALGLILGVVTGGLAMRTAWRRQQIAEARLRAASGAFMDLVAERFETWGLTPAERDVALFSLKGLSTTEIAQLRSTSDGTVKAQCAAIYRKAGVSSRSQLLSLFIDDLMAEMPALAA